MLEKNTTEEQDFEFSFEQSPKETDQNFNARKKYPSLVWQGLSEPKCSKEKFTKLYLIDECIPSAVERMLFGLKNGCITSWQQDAQGQKGKDCSMECDSFNNREDSSFN
jgi:hypothetical protein